MSSRNHIIYIITQITFTSNYYVLVRFLLLSWSHGTDSKSQSFLSIERPESVLSIFCNFTLLLVTLHLLNAKSESPEFFTSEGYLVSAIAHSLQSGYGTSGPKPVRCYVLVQDPYQL